MDVQEAAKELLDRLPPCPWPRATFAVRDGQVHVERSPDSASFTDASLFQAGSISKTVVGLLLADAVVREEATLDTTVGDILGADAGNCKTLTLRAVASQHSGLPKLPPNLDPAAVDPHDPYGAYTESDLLGALTTVELSPPGFVYSNFGFMLLGLLLRRVTGSSIADLFRARVTEPLGLVDSIIGVPSSGDVLAGHAQDKEVGWWSNPLPGAGGLTTSARDLATYALAWLSPPPALADAMALASTEHGAGPPPVGLAWVLQRGGLLHDGATGGFMSFVGIHPPSRNAVGYLISAHLPENPSRAALGVLSGLLAAD